jgi:hypothetical protein
MAAPNIVSVTTITGKTAVLTATTTATAIVTNSAASGKVLKINTLNIANVNGTTAADITVDLYRNSTAYRLLSTVSVPADASLVAVSKDTSIYLEEGDSLRLTASANSYLEGTCSYEEIS